tara:strand:+ start:1369 stop:1641 length:273 start_codon:yes stop_codon:yes gene_type:complete
MSKEQNIVDDYTEEIIHDHYKSLLGYTIVKIGINPDNPRDVRLYLSKQHKENELVSYTHLAVAPCKDASETEAGWLSIMMAETEENTDEG